MRSHPIGNGVCAPYIPREMAALIAALQMKGATVDGLLELQEREWMSLLKFCEPAHLTLPLAQVAGAGFPSWVVERLRKNAADNYARFDRVKATYQEAAAALDRAGVEHLLLKGFTQVPGYAADARFRVQSDLDFYCPKEMGERAWEALTQIGYQADKRMDYTYADHLPTMIRLGDWQWRGNPFDPEMPLSVEVHFCLWNEAISGFPVPEMDRFWERRIKRSIEDVSFFDLSPVDHLGYLAMHILRGVLNGDWVIHHVYEMAVFLHRHAEDDAFWRTWKQTHSQAFRELQCFAFFHSMCWFCCDLHADVLKEIAAMPRLHQEWLERFAGSAVESMFRKNKDRVWLHASLVQPTRKRLKLVWQAITPPRMSRIPSVSSSSVRVRNRQIIEPVISNRYLQYVSYILDRTIDYFRVVPTLMLRGAILWLSQLHTRRQFNQ